MVAHPRETENVGGRHHSHLPRQHGAQCGTETFFVLHVAVLSQRCGVKVLIFNAVVAVVGTYQGIFGGVELHPAQSCESLVLAHGHLAEEKQTAVEVGGVEAEVGVFGTRKSIVVVDSLTRNNRIAEFHVVARGSDNEVGVLVLQMSAEEVLGDVALFGQLALGAVVARLVVALQIVLLGVEVFGGYKGAVAFHMRVESGGRYVFADADGGGNAIHKAVFGESAGGTHVLRVFLHRSVAGKVESRARPQRESLPELQLVVAHDKLFQKTEIVEHQAKAVEIVALRLRAFEKLLASVLVARKR